MRTVSGEWMASGYRTLALALGVGALGACRDPENVAAPTPQGQPRRSAAAMAPDSVPGYFAADVQVHALRDAGPTKIPGLERQASFHVEQRRSPNGTTASTFTFDPPARHTLGTKDVTPPGIARIEMSDDSTPPRAFDFSGKPVSTRSDPNLASRVRRQTGIPLPEPTTFARPTAQTGNRPSGPAPSPIEGIVLGPGARGRTLAGVRRYFGAAQGEVKGRERYVAQHGDATLELLVDPATGLVAEQSVTVNGEVKQRVTFGYTRLPNDAYVRSSAHAEFAPRGASERRTVVDMTISNIRATP